MSQIQLDICEMLPKVNFLSSARTRTSIFFSYYQNRIEGDTASMLYRLWEPSPPEGLPFVKNVLQHFRTVRSLHRLEEDYAERNMNG